MDRLFINATVLTMDRALREADAFAVSGERFSHVGSSQELLRKRERSTEVMDLGGSTVVPGFIDAHTHFGPLVLSAEEIDLSERHPQDIQELQDRLAAAARDTQDGAWIRAFGYAENLLKEQRHPTRWELDEAVPERPVIIIHWGYHRLVANSEALARAGIRRGNTEVSCGVIHCDETGEPDGLLTEAGTNSTLQAAIDSVYASRQDVLMDWVEAACRRHLADGITAVQDAWVSSQFESLYRQAAAEGRMPLYFTPLRGHSEGLFGTPAPWLEPGAIDGSNLPSHLRRGGIKLFASGVWENILYYSQEELNRLMEEAHRMGLAVAVHVSSNPGTEMAIQAVEHTRRKVLNSDAPIRLEHFFWSTPSDIERLKAAGAGVVTQPASMWRLGARATQPVAQGVRRMPVASLQSSGVRVAFSSDAPCFAISPMVAVQAAVTRRTRAGDEIAPEEAVSVEDALRMYTLDAAWASGTEDAEGSISPGKLANFAVLPADPRKVPPSQISQLKVVQTWVDGQRAFQRENEPATAD